MKSVVAFANTTGGTIIFGIDDKTLDDVGMDEENIFQTVDAISNAISDNCVPKIVPDVYLQTIDGKKIIFVDIAPGLMRPYYIKDQGIMKGTYIRGGTSRHAEGYIPTNAFALLTGKMPDQPKIQCAVFKGTTRDYFIDRKEFSGSIQEQIDDAYRYVLEKINMGMELNGIYRQNVYELPVRSICEVIANAIVHRSYMEPGNVLVAIYDDRLEVSSPGALPCRATIEKIRNDYSKLRNEAIANAFSYVKIIERWGTGISRIIRQSENTD